MRKSYRFWACPIDGCAKVSVSNRITCPDHGRRMVEIILERRLKERTSDRLNPFFSPSLHESPFREPAIDTISGPTLLDRLETRELAKRARADRKRIKAEKKASRVPLLVRIGSAVLAKNPRRQKKES